jgi:DNA polymerase-3 subunit delta
METILMLGDSKILKNKKIEEIIDNNKNAELVRISSENYDDEVLDKTFTMGSLFAKEKTIIFSEFTEFKIPQQEKILKFLSKQKDAFIGTVIVDAKKESKSISNVKFDKKFDYPLPLPWQDDLWIKFVKNISTMFGKNIDDDTAYKFLELIGKSEELLYEEIRKVAIYIDKDKITYEEVKEILSVFPTTTYEELCYSLAKKDFVQTLDRFNGLTNSPQFSPIALNSYLFNYYLDFLFVVLNAETKPSYSWPEISKISKDSEVSQQRVANFLGFNFKTDKERKINLKKLYTTASIENILLKIEEIDRLLKMGENPKVLFSNLFHYICYEGKS